MILKKILCFFGLHNWELLDPTICAGNVYWGYRCVWCKEGKIEWGRRHRHSKNPLVDMFKIR